MRVLGWLIAGCVCLGVCGAPMASAAAQAVQEASVTGAMAKARDRVLPVVVSIMVVREDFQQGQPVLSVSSGSGTVVTPQGHIATNAHVVQKGRNFRVVFGDGREMPARLVGADPLTDLAVLQAQPDTQQTFAHASFAERLELRAGDTVYAMGAPWGLSNSMSAGVVNNPRRLLVSLFGDEADYEARLSADEPTGRYYAWIQHDAAIAPGNSGGPLVDAEGRIVGVNSRAMIMGGDLAFAIPGPDAADVVSTLIEQGKVTRAHFGFRLRSLKGSRYREGVLVTAIERDSVAARAGLRVGDRLLSLAGTRINAVQPVDVPAVQRRIAELPVGVAVALVLDRAGKHVELSLTPEALARDGSEEVGVTALGISVLELTPAMSRQRNLETERGLLVAGLRPGGPAATARPALQRGDVLLRVAGQAAGNSAALAKVLPTLVDGTPVVLEFSRNGEQRIAVLNPQFGDRERVPLPELPKAWAGAEVQPLPISLARDAGLPSAGFRIVRLYPGGPLAKAGARVGDLLVALEGEPLRPSNETSDDTFQQRVRDLAPGSEVTFDVIRGEARLSLTPTLATAPPSASGLRTLAVARLRVQLRELGFYDRIARRMPEQANGVLVDGVEAGGPAGLAHLRNGDVIVALEDRPLAHPAELAAALERRLKQHPDAAMSLTVLRGAETRILYLEPHWLMETP